MTEIELKEFSVKDNNVSLGGLGMGVQQVGGGGGITQETDPTVPNWAKQPNKPTYDYSEIENTPDLEKIEEETELAKNKAEIALTTAENAEQNAKNYTDQKFNGANKAVSFVNYSSMISSLNTLPYGTYNIGQNIMIVTLEVPDLWVSSYEVEKVPYTYVSDTDFIYELKANGSVQVGHYRLSALETQKVDLVDYVKNTDYATTDKAGAVKVSASAINGIYIDELGKIGIERANDTLIKAKVNIHRPIVPENLDYAVKVGVTTNTIDLTDAEKLNAQIWLGIDTLIGDIETALDGIISLQNELIGGGV